MYALSCSIRFYTQQGCVEFDSASAVSIRRDADQLCHTCSITLPRRVNWVRLDGIPIGRGDRVEVQLGYDGHNQPAYVGYVRQVHLGPPTTVECLCPVSLLQQQPAQRLSYASATLNQLLADQGVQAIIGGEQHIGAYRVQADTVAQLLDDLRQQGFRFVGRLDAQGQHRLYAGLLISPSDAPTFAFEEGCNIISRADLRVADPDTLRFCVRVQAVGHSAQQPPVELGDADGELRTFSVVGMDAAQMRSYGEQQLQRLREGRIGGAFTTFGGHTVQPMDHLQITLDGSPTVQAVAQKVEIDWDSNGFRQKIEVRM